VKFEDGENLAKKFQFDYIEVSAKTGLNINILFEILCKSMIKKSEELEFSKSKSRSNKTKFLMDKSVYMDRSDREKEDKGCIC
jgi:hypothetical protein